MSGSTVRAKRSASSADIFRPLAAASDEEVLDWVRDALKASHADEQKEQEQAILRCQKEYKRLEDRLHAMYLDKLDGRIDSAFYDRMSAQWRVEQTRLLREIERHGAAEESYMEDGVRLLELARNARQLFARQAPGEKKRLLNLLLVELHMGRRRGSRNLSTTV